MLNLKRTTIVAMMIILAGCAAIDETKETEKTRSETEKTTRSSTPVSAKPKAVDPSSVDFALEYAELVFEDDFDRPELGPNWLPFSGEWEIQDGTLLGRDNAQIVCEKRIADAMRVEYTTWTTSPCDLDVFLGVPDDDAIKNPASKSTLFQLGGMHNKRAAVIARRRPLWVSDKHPIVRRRKYRVVCERWGKVVRFFINGDLWYSGLDQGAENVREKERGDSVNTDRFGFFIFSVGYMDDVKAYRLHLPPPSEIVPPERALKVKKWLGFNDLKERIPPDGCVAPGDPAPTIVNVRDYEYRPLLNFWKKLSDPEKEKEWPKWIDDGCVKLTSLGDNSGEPALLTYSFSALDAGLAEVELLAKPAADGTFGSFKLELLDADGTPVVSVETDTDGTFVAKGNKEVVKLKNKIHYPHVDPASRLVMTPNRWFRLRIHFDCEKQTYSVYLVRLYQKGARWGGDKINPLADWLELGENIPFAASPKDGALSQVRIATNQPGTLYADNLYVIGPFNGTMVAGKLAQHPARKLIDSGERPRKDPLDPRIYSLRETWDATRPGREFVRLVAGEHPEILKAADQYNRLLVEYMMARLRLDTLEQAARYLMGMNDGSKVPDVARFRAEMERLYCGLRQLHTVYADAYMDNLNAETIRQSFDPLGKSLRESFQNFGKRISLRLSAYGWKPPATRSTSGRATLSAQNGEITKDGEKRFVFLGRMNTIAPPVQLGWDIGGLMNMDGCQLPFSMWMYETPKGEYFNKTAARKNLDGLLKKFPSFQFKLKLFLGLHESRSPTPPWWVEEHENDDDLFFQNPEGKRVPQPRIGYNGPIDRRVQCLNFWNEDVLDMQRRQARSLGKFLQREYPNACPVMEVMQEAKNFAGRGAGSSTTGRNDSSVKAFRSKMRQTYETIDKLNKEWGTSYVSFSDIKPPPEPERRSSPTPLAYEWEVFRQDGYRDWIKSYMDAVRDSLPDVVFTNALGGSGMDYLGRSSCRQGFDLTRLAGILDYMEFHCAGSEVVRARSKVLNSLGDAYGVEGALLEYGLANSGDLFDDEAAGVAEEAELFRLAADGRSMFSIWGVGASGWGDTYSWGDARLGWTIMRQPTAAMAAMIPRLRSLERELLDHPFVKPNVNVFESTATFLNSGDIALRLKMKQCASMLEEAGWNFGFLWERAILDEKQSLDDSDVIFMPCAQCVPRKMQNKLVKWIKNGGILVALSTPPGVFDQWGRDDGKLLKAIFGDVKWIIEDKAWKPSGDGAPKRREIGKATCYLAEMGKGKFYFFDDLYGVPKLEWFDDILKNVKRKFYATGNKVELTLRDAGEKWIMTVLNPNCFQSITDEIHFRGPEVVVRNVEIPKLEIPSKRVGDETVFNVELAPGEGVVLELEDIRNKTRKTSNQ